MRKLLTLGLLLCFGLPFASALLALAPRAEASLPVCCRRAGEHHCSMPASERAQLLDGVSRVMAPPSRCPFRPAGTLPGRNPELWAADAGSALFAGLLSHPAVFSQTLARARISRVRAHGKRGPPSLA